MWFQYSPSEMFLRKRGCHEGMSDMCIGIIRNWDAIKGAPTVFYFAVLDGSISEPFDVVVGAD